MDDELTGGRPAESRPVPYTHAGLARRDVVAGTDGIGSIRGDAHLVADGSVEETH